MINIIKLILIVLNCHFTSNHSYLFVNLNASSMNMNELINCNEIIEREENKNETFL